MVKVQKRWRLGDTPVSLRLRYECPLEEVGRFYEPPARLLLRCASPGQSGHAVPGRMPASRLHTLAMQWILLIGSAMYVAPPFQHRVISRHHGHAVFAWFHSVELQGHSEGLCGVS